MVRPSIIFNKINTALTFAFLTCFYSSCSETKFQRSGSTVDSANREKTNAPAGPNEEPEETPDPTDLNDPPAGTHNNPTSNVPVGGTTTIGGSVQTAPPVNCQSNEIEDANATFQFTSNDQIRTFVNSFCKAQIPVAWKNQGGLRNDDATKKAICNLKGYKYVYSVVGFSWHSPRDNHVAWWLPEQKKFYVKYNATDNNFLLNGLVCQTKLYSQCITLASTIDCVQ